MRIAFLAWAAADASGRRAKNGLLPTGAALGLAEAMQAKRRQNRGFACDAPFYADNEDVASDMDQQSAHF